MDSCEIDIGTGHDGSFSLGQKPYHSCSPPQKTPQSCTSDYFSAIDYSLVEEHEDSQERLFEDADFEDPGPPDSLLYQEAELDSEDPSDDNSGSMYSSCYSSLSSIDSPMSWQSARSSPSRREESLSGTLEQLKTTLQQVRHRRLGVETAMKIILGLFEIPELPPEQNLKNQEPCAMQLSNKDRCVRNEESRKVLGCARGDQMNEIWREQETNALHSTQWTLTGDHCNVPPVVELLDSAVHYMPKEACLAAFSQHDSNANVQHDEIPAVTEDETSEDTGSSLAAPTPASPTSTVNEDFNATPHSMSSDTQSPASCVSDLTDDSEFNLAASILSSDKIQSITEELVSHFGRLIELRLGVNELAGNDNNDSSAQYSQTPQNDAQASSNVVGQSNEDHGKSSRQKRRDKEGSGEDPDENDSSSKRRKIDEVPTPQRIACPYLKKWPGIFSKKKTCVGPGFPSMARMKEHLTRRHARQHCCARCGEYFEKPESLNAHLRAEDACQKKSVATEPGYMTPLQCTKISTETKKHGSVEAKWKKIWLILFPDAKEESIPSPYFETSEFESTIASLFDPRECEEYVKSHLDPMYFSWLQQWLERATEQAKQELRVMIGGQITLLLNDFTEENIRSSCECAPLDGQERHTSEPSKPTTRVLESKETHCENHIGECRQTWEQLVGSNMQSADEQVDWNPGNEQSWADGDLSNANEHSYGVFEADMEGNDFNLDPPFDFMSSADVVQVSESVWRVFGQEYTFDDG